MLVYRELKVLLLEKHGGVISLARHVRDALPSRVDVLIKQQVIGGRHVIVSIARDALFRVIQVEAVLVQLGDNCGVNRNRVRAHHNAIIVSKLHLAVPRVTPDTCCLISTSTLEGRASRT